MNIDEFEDEVMFNVMLGNVTPKITDREGNTPIVACLDDEPIREFLARLNRAGNSATVFSRSADNKVRVFSVVESDCALCVSPIDLRQQELSEDSPVGLFLDLVELSNDGVVFPDMPVMRARSYGSAELLSA